MVNQGKKGLREQNRLIITKMGAVKNYNALKLYLLHKKAYLNSSKIAIFFYM
jgi:hypothetical protein